ncbi:DNA primase [Streptomyces sp. NBC_00078]|uniref:DNA primase n=1 Tax=unclassified Streptomyces TaxID=2593676 RepID=UPI0022563033|nr:DNA primase [Streptomyces sp. NBC_00078]MCX5424876.1 DNA primase [Streptomyces sp. NBC_00078]
MNRVGLGLAVGAGYFLGRTKKMKMAFALGTLVAGKRMHLSPRAIADLVSQQLQNNPQFKEIGDQLREDLRGVGKAASGAMVERQIDALADRLHGRTAEVRDQLTGVAGQATGLGSDEEDENGEPEDTEEEPREDEPEDDEPQDEEPREDDDEDDDEEGPEAEEESSDRAARRAPARKTAKKTAKKAAAKKTAPAKKAPAKKAAAKRTASKQAPAKKTAKKTAARKTSAARGGARAAQSRLPKGGGE